MFYGAGYGKRAAVILANLEEGELDLRGKPKRAHAESDGTSPGYVQLGLFGPQPNPAVEKLKELDVDNMTPMDALSKLKQLKDELDGGS